MQNNLCQEKEWQRLRPALPTLSYQGLQRASCDHLWRRAVEFSPVPVDRGPDQSYQRSDMDVGNMSIIKELR